MVPYGDRRAGPTVRHGFMPTCYRLQLIAHRVLLLLGGDHSRCLPRILTRTLGVQEASKQLLPIVLHTDHGSALTRLLGLAHFLAPTPLGSGCRGHFRSSHQSSRTQASRRLHLPRCLQPHTPLDGPACCRASGPSREKDPTPPPVRPWRELKSRREAPQRVNTPGVACPNRACMYLC
jgi:hypothetical protein